MSNETINDYPDISLWEDIPRDIKVVIKAYGILFMIYLPITLLLDPWNNYTKMVEVIAGILMIYLMVRLFGYEGTWKSVLKAIANLIGLIITIISGLIFAKDYSGEYIFGVSFPFEVTYEMNKVAVEMLAITQGKIVKQLGEEIVTDLGMGIKIITIFYLSYWAVNLLKRRTTSFIDYKRTSLKIIHSFIELIALGAILVVILSGLVWFDKFYTPTPGTAEEEEITWEVLLWILSFIVVLLLVPAIKERLPTLLGKLRERIRKRKEIEEVYNIN
ncbi:MAG: hypothetical protein ACTSYA_09330 [Candidatus Kariarchaeaceae archaeon]